jgi:hypothetical protein
MQNTSLTKTVTFTLLVAYGMTSMIPSSVHAEVLSGKSNSSSLALSQLFHAPAGVAVHEIKMDQTFLIEHASEKIIVQLLPEKPGNILINGQLFVYSLNDSEKALEGKLRHWLQSKFTLEKVSSLEKFFNLFIPSSHAISGWVIGLAAVAIVGIIVAISMKKKSKENIEKIADNRARMRRNAIQQERATRHIARFKEATAAAEAESSASSSSVESITTAETETASTSTGTENTDSEFHITE